MSEQFFDLEVERLSDKHIRLTQNEGDRADMVDLHPEQVRFIARQLAGMTSGEAGAVAEFERRFSVLTGKLQNIIGDADFRADVLTRCGNGSLWLARLDAIADLALEFDGGRLAPKGQGADETPAAGSEEGATSAAASIDDDAASPAAPLQPALAL